MLQIVTEIADVQPVQPSGGSADNSGGAVQAIVTTSHALINQHNDVCFCATLKSRVQNIDDLEADITEVSCNIRTPSNCVSSLPKHICSLDFRSLAISLDWLGPYCFLISFVHVPIANCAPALMVTAIVCR